MDYACLVIRRTKLDCIFNIYRNYASLHQSDCSVLYVLFHCGWQTVTYPNGTYRVMKELATGDDVEIPDLGFQIAVKEQLNGDLIVDRERAELDAQVGLFAVVQNFWADFDLNRNRHCYGLVLIAILPPRMHEL